MDQQRFQTYVIKFKWNENCLLLKFFLSPFSRKFMEFFHSTKIYENEYKKRFSKQQPISP